MAEVSRRGKPVRVGVGQRGTSVRGARQDVGDASTSGTSARGNELARGARRHVEHPARGGRQRRGTPVRGGVGRKGPSVGGACRHVGVAGTWASVRTPALPLGAHCRRLLRLGAPAPRASSSEAGDGPAGWSLRDICWWRVPGVRHTPGERGV